MFKSKFSETDFFDDVSIVNPVNFTVNKFFFIERKY